MTPQDNQNPQPNQQPPVDPQPAPSEYVAHPGPGQQPQFVYVTRPHEPLQPEMSADQRQRHEESKKKFPELNLSDGEYIINAINRHPIGLVQIWAAVGLAMAFIFFVVFLMTGGSGQSGMSPEVLAIPAILIAALVLLFGFIATSIYNANKFFLTNESVIQQIQHGIFVKKEQTVSLSNIEDASYDQHGILPHILNYGRIRLSTEGDETTYRFNYVSNPRKQIGTLNNAVEAFKNGRPVTGENQE